MFIELLSLKQKKEISKKMLIAEAKTNSYYQKNLINILNESLFTYSIQNDKKSKYLVLNIKNGDIFVFDDFNYIKFENPSMRPTSMQLNIKIYNKFMCSKFSDYAVCAQKYNEDTQKVVDFINFCDNYIGNCVNRKNKDRLVEIEK